MRLITSSRASGADHDLSVPARGLRSGPDRLDFGGIVLNTDKVLRIICVNSGQVAAPIRWWVWRATILPCSRLVKIWWRTHDHPCRWKPQMIEVRYTAAHLRRRLSQGLARSRGAVESMWTVDPWRGVRE